MPFDGSGNFTSLGPPDFPAVTGATISSAYYNSQLNDIFTGLSNVLCRDGQSTVSGNFNWNNKNLANVAAFSCATISINGSAFTPSSYLLLAGGTMTGALTMTTGANEQIKLLATNPYMSGYNAAGSTLQGYVQFGAATTRLESSTGDVRLATGGSDRLTISAAGLASFSNGATVAGSVQSTGAASEFRFYDRTAGSGQAFVWFADAGSARLFSAQSAATVLTVSSAGALACGAISGTSLAISGTGAFTGVVTGPTAIAGTNTTQLATTAFVQTGIGALSTVYAALSGATFSGAFGRDANFNLDLVSSNPRITMDSTDYIWFDRVANKLYIAIGGTNVLSIDASGNLKTLANITSTTTP